MEAQLKGMTEMKLLRPNISEGNACAVPAMHTTFPTNFSFVQDKIQ